MVRSNRGEVQRAKPAHGTLVGAALDQPQRPGEHPPLARRGELLGPPGVRRRHEAARGAAQPGVGRVPPAEQQPLRLDELVEAQDPGGDGDGEDPAFGRKHGPGRSPDQRRRCEKADGQREDPSQPWGSAQFHLPNNGSPYSDISATEAATASGRRCAGSASTSAAREIPVRTSAARAPARRAIAISRLEVVADDERAARRAAERATHLPQRHGRRAFRACAPSLRSSGGCRRRRRPTSRARGPPPTENAARGRGREQRRSRPHGVARGRGAPRR